MIEELHKISTAVARIEESQNNMKEDIKEIKVKHKPLLDIYAFLKVGAVFTGFALMIWKWLPNV